MPKRNYITAKKNEWTKIKIMKDRLSFGANASGDLKLKLLLVYHSDNPRAFK